MQSRNKGRGIESDILYIICKPETKNTTGKILITDQGQQRETTNPIIKINNRESLLYKPRTKVSKESKDHKPEKHM